MSTPTASPTPSVGDVIDGILARTGRIAVVGLSDRHFRPSWRVAAALQQRGFDIIPVNPEVDEVLGVKAVASLGDVDGPVDLVDVFRRHEHLPGVAQEAVAINAGGLWNQLGLRSPGAAAIAAGADMPYVEDRCLAVEVDHRDADPVGVDGVDRD